MDWLLHHIIDGTATALVFSAIVWLFWTTFLGSYVAKKAGNLATKEDVKLLTYLSEKGKNLAAREDLDALTREVEKVKAEFGREATEHRVLFEKLHERRAAVVPELYRLLVEVAWAAESLGNAFTFTGEPSKLEKYDAFMKTVPAYFRYLDTNKLFLPPDLFDLLHAFARDARSPAILFGIYLQIEGPTDRTKEETHQAWDEMRKFATEEVPKLRAEVERRFRTLLDPSISVAGS